MSISESEIFIEDTDFKFYSKPYFLRLNLPGEIIEDGRETANYDADKGTFTIKVPKKKPGEEFKGLDMLTKLLAPKGQRSAQQPVIEILGEASAVPSDVLEEEDFDWTVEQTPFSEPDTALSSEGQKYGFGSLRSGVFKRLQSELSEVTDVKDQDLLSAEERRSQRRGEEDEKFDDDHYLADLYQDDAIQELLEFSPPWLDGWKKLDGDNTELVKLTEEEKEKIRKLPNKEYLIDSCHLPAVYFSLVDIIYAYAFNYRLTEGEFNVESGWTICKLSATLSWLEVFSSLQEVMVTNYRRALTFPLYRHWRLLEAVKQDTVQILSLGRAQILKCLLDVQSILTDTDQRYILNDLYINDYCVWIQGVSNTKLSSLADALKKISLEKRDVGFGLEELEIAASAVVAEEDEGVLCRLENLAVADNTDRDSDDDSTDCDDTESETEDEGTEYESTDTGDENTDTGDENTDIGDENADNNQKNVKTGDERTSESRNDKNTKTNYDDTKSTQCDDMNTKTNDESTNYDDVKSTQCDDMNTKTGDESTSESTNEKNIKIDDGNTNCDDTKITNSDDMNTKTDDGSTNCDDAKITKCDDVNTKTGKSTNSGDGSVDRVSSSGSKEAERCDVKTGECNEKCSSASSQIKNCGKERLLCHSRERVPSGDDKKDVEQVQSDGRACATNPTVRNNDETSDDSRPEDVAGLIPDINHLNIS